MEQSNSKEESLDHFVKLATIAISGQRYKEALRHITEGLETSIESEKRADIRKILVVQHPCNYIGSQSARSLW